jgi:hypothetical protein
MRRWAGRDGGTSGTMELTIVGDGFGWKDKSRVVRWCVLYSLSTGRYWLQL